MKPFLDPSFWSDREIEQQKAGVKLSALWLITNSQTSLLGICGASDQRFHFETGLPVEALQSTIEALPGTFSRIGNVIFVRNYVRHQFGTGEKLMRNNFFVALRSLFLSVKDEVLRVEILKEYPEFTQALNEGLQRASQAQGKERNGKDGKESAERKPMVSIEDATDYGKEIGMTSDEVQAWHDHFTSNGWRVSGKAPMKDWKSALRNGKRNVHLFKPKNGDSQRDPSHHIPSLSEQQQ